jgi:hypothetical protein
LTEIGTLTLTLVVSRKPSGYGRFNIKGGNPCRAHNDIPAPAKRMHG